MGMKQILLMMVAVVVVGCGKDARKAEPLPEPDPAPPAEDKVITIADPFVEGEIRASLEKPDDEITEADLEKVLWLSLEGTKITDAVLMTWPNCRSSGNLT